MEKLLENVRNPQIGPKTLEYTGKSVQQPRKIQEVGQKEVIFL